MSTHWRKSPAELVERFEAAIAGVDGLEPRQMFGYPASFIGGNLTTSLHEDRWIVRLPDEERQARLDAGWAQFEPMPGRPMRGYVVMPAEVAADPDASRDWVERAAAYVRTLPPKPARKR
ncbi:MAG TPA: TfoX/Sxy family protein [Candidatus Limnocylindria bacterium]|nr:TfoX/Sxy family protein [Candidatus Limnocylindria bacterium]